MFVQHMWAQLGYAYDLDVDMTNVQELQLLLASLGNYDLEALSSFFQFIQLPLLDRLFVRVTLELAQSSNFHGERVLKPRVPDVSLLLKI